jgi:hypothetical protein
MNLEKNFRGAGGALQLGANTSGSDNGSDLRTAFGQTLCFYRRLGTL